MLFVGYWLHIPVLFFITAFYYKHIESTVITCHITVYLIALKKLWR